MSLEEVYARNAAFFAERRREHLMGDFVEICVIVGIGLCAVASVVIAAWALAHV